MDIKIFEATTDLLCILPKYLKNDFKPMFKKLFGSLLKQMDGSDIENTI
jgi:hypothetical protein